MLKNIKSDYGMNYSPCPVFCKYNYYICTVFFHGIRFKVKNIGPVATTGPMFFCEVMLR